METFQELSCDVMTQNEKTISHFVRLNEFLGFLYNNNPLLSQEIHSLKYYNFNFQPQLFIYCIVNKYCDSSFILPFNELFPEDICQFVVNLSKFSYLEQWNHLFNLKEHNPILYEKIIELESIIDKLKTEYDTFTFNQMLNELVCFNEAYISELTISKTANKFMHLYYQVSPAEKNLLLANLKRTQFLVYERVMEMLKFINSSEKQNEKRPFIRSISSDNLSNDRSIFQLPCSYQSSRLNRLLIRKNENNEKEKNHEDNYRNLTEKIANMNISKEDQQEIDHTQQQHQEFKSNLMHLVKSNKGLQKPSTGNEFRKETVNEKKRLGSTNHNRRSVVNYSNLPRSLSYATYLKLNPSEAPSVCETQTKFNKHNQLIDQTLDQMNPSLEKNNNMNGIIHQFEILRAEQVVYRALKKGNVDKNEKIKNEIRLKLRKLLKFELLLNAMRNDEKNSVKYNNDLVFIKILEDYAREKEIEVYEKYSSNENQYFNSLIEIILCISINKHAFKIEPK